MNGWAAPLLLGVLLAGPGSTVQAQNAGQFLQSLTGNEAVQVYPVPSETGDPNSLSAMPAYVTTTMLRGGSAGGPFRSIPTIDFVQLYAYGGGTTNNGLIEGDNGQPGLVAAARTLNSAVPGNAPAGFFAFGFNDKTTPFTIANWAIYEENRRYVGAGTAVGTELDITEFNNNASQMDPYILSYGVGNMSAGMYIQSGGGCTVAGPCYNPATGTTNLAAQNAGVAIAIGNNGAQFYEGLQFNYNAINGNDGKGTPGNFGRAINMPSGDAIIWNYCNDTSSSPGLNYPAHCGANSLGVFILSSVTSLASVQKLTFDDVFGFILQNGNNNFMFEVPVSTTYVNGIKLQPNTTGNDVLIQPTGGDAVVNLQLAGLGGGNIIPKSQVNISLGAIGNLINNSVQPLQFQITDTNLDAIQFFFVRNAGGTTWQQTDFTMRRNVDSVTETSFSMRGVPDMTFGIAGTTYFQITTTGNISYNPVQFGGVTASFPALKRSTTSLIARLADDSADTDFEAKSFTSGGSVPTITGTCTAPSAQAGGNTAGTFTVGAAGACAAGTYILTFGLTAPTGWACQASDRTTITDTVQQTASSTTTATFKATTANNDVVSYSCMAY
jgi:hypothetical protein